MSAAKLFDLTATNIVREMQIQEAFEHPLADPSFKRQVAEVTTREQRQDKTDRLHRLRDTRRAA